MLNVTVACLIKLFVGIMLLNLKTKSGIGDTGELIELDLN